MCLLTIDMILSVLPGSSTVGRHRQAGLHSREDADPMRLAVRDVDDAGGADEHGMRPRERAAPGVAVGPVASLSGTEHGPDHAALEIDLADRVILGIRDQQ